MSAFAAFLSNDRPKSSYITPEHRKNLFSELVSCSNLRLTPQNSILTNTSIFLGLHEEDVIIMNGSFELCVHRGACLINNVHHIEQSERHKIIATKFKSLPVICSTPSKLQPDGFTSLLPQYQTVIELRNLRTGLEELNKFFPKQNELYYSAQSGYTFELVTGENETLFGVHYDTATMRILDYLSQLLSTETDSPESVLVFGANNCGKTTFAKALCDNVAKATRKPIAYMDLDPNRSEDSVPGCLSITIRKSPNFGVSFPRTVALSEEDDLQCYYGFQSPLSQPERYFQCFRVLLSHYSDHIYPKGIPIVINTPGWIRGFGKDLLSSILHESNPSQLVYFSHNDAIHVDDYEADNFEAQDNPDDEVLSGLSFPKLTTLRGVRRASNLKQNSIQQHDLMTYFHRTGESNFDFSKPLLSSPPVKLFYEKAGSEVYVSGLGVSAVSVLGYDLDKLVNPDDIKLLSDTTVMALCLVNEELIPKHDPNEWKTKKELKDLPRYINSSDILLKKSEFVSLCMVHSINTKDGYFNVYLPRDGHEITEFIIGKPNTQILLVRGEGEIPLAEMMHQGLTSQRLPYVSYETKSKIGGVWKVRHNIRRKNQK